MDIVVVAFGILLTAVLLAVLLAERRDRRAMADRRSRLTARPTQDVETWFRTHYMSFGIDQPLVITVLSKLAGTIKCDMTQILPSDSFGEDLRLRNIWPVQIDPDDELTYFTEVELENLLGGSVPPEELLSVKNSGTVEELLRRIDAVRRRER